MSGGHFNYDQWRIQDIANEVEDIIEKNGKVIPWDELDDFYQRDYDYNEHTYEKSENKILYYDYPPEVVERFKEGLYHLRRAYIYTQRIDWLLSGDDGEESFIERLNEELKELERKRE